MKSVVFGSRGSDLALTQTRTIIRRFHELYPDKATTLRIIRTTGDNNPDAPLAEIGGLGAFTREIETALLSHDIDVAVHSLKDLPVVQPEGLHVAAVVERETPHDVLVSVQGDSLEALPANAAVGTSSLRRKVQLLAVRPDLDIRELRGNVPTRLRRVREGRLDAAILAAAGLVRLGLIHEPGIWELPLDIMLPAPGQGALALETRAGACELGAILAPLHDADAAAAVTCERAVLQAFGGGCRAPLGAYAAVREGRLYLRAFAGEEEGSRIARFEGDADKEDACALGEEAGTILRERLRRPTSRSAGSGRPLQDRRIIITRATHQSESLAGKFEQAGAKVFHLPLIDIVPNDEVSPPESLQAFDWIVFTSVNAVNCFEACIARAGRSLADCSACRIAAIGEATAGALKAKGITPETVPETHVSGMLAAALLDVEKQPAGKRVLIPQSDIARTIIADALTAAGMSVTPLTVYHTRSRTPSRKMMDDLARFQPEFVALFSPSAVKAYRAGGAHDVLVEQAVRPVYVSIGPVTTAALEEDGLGPVIEAQGQSEESLIAAIIASTRSDTEALDNGE